MADRPQRARIIPYVNVLRTEGFHSADPNLITPGDANPTTLREEIISYTKPLLTALDVPFDEAVAITLQEIVQSDTYTAEIDSTEGRPFTALTLDLFLTSAAIVDALPTKFVTGSPADRSNMVGYVELQQVLAEDGIPLDILKRHRAALNNAFDSMRQLLEVIPEIEGVPADGEVYQQLALSGKRIIDDWAMNFHRDDFLAMRRDILLGDLTSFGSTQFRSDAFKATQGQNGEWELTCVSPAYQKLRRNPPLHTTPHVGCSAGFSDALNIVWNLVMDYSPDIYQRLAEQKRSQ